MTSHYLMPRPMGMLSNYPMNFTRPPISRSFGGLQAPPGPTFAYSGTYGGARKKKKIKDVVIATNTIGCCLKQAKVGQLKSIIKALKVYYRRKGDKAALVRLRITKVGGGQKRKRDLMRMIAKEYPKGPEVRKIIRSGARVMIY